MNAYKDTEELKEIVVTIEDEAYLASNDDDFDSIVSNCVNK